jgi:hypothetical protein
VAGFTDREDEDPEKTKYHRKVVFENQASTIERTKTRKNCRCSSIASTSHAGGNLAHACKPIP